MIVFNRPICCNEIQELQYLCAVLIKYDDTECKEKGKPKQTSLLGVVTAARVPYMQYMCPV